MPTIHEQDEREQLANPDFATLLSLPEDLPIEATAGQDVFQSFLPPQMDPAEYALLSDPSLVMLTLSFLSFLSNDFMDAWDLPEPSAEPYFGLEEPDYAKFENVSGASIQQSLDLNLLTMASSTVDPAVHPPVQALRVLPR